MEIRIYGYFNSFQQNNTRILLKNAMKIQKLSESAMLP